MDTRLDLALSAELQELYLENKEWLSKVLFLEDEMRFFKRLFNKVLSGEYKRENLQQVRMVSSKLNLILERRKLLKNVLCLRRHQLEQLLVGNTLSIGIEFIEADAAIKVEIEAIMAGENSLKCELFTLIERQNSIAKPIISPKLLKVKRYPLL
jgi:hypothetical protein